MNKTVAIIGAGPAGLMAADVLSAAGAAVVVYDRMPSIGRKFLLAGRGGLNLTHSEQLETFLSHYGEARPHLEAAIRRFPPDALRAFSESHGQPTFVGSSGRVFPRALKASPLLRAWLRALQARRVTFHLRHHWRGWNDAGELVFASPAGAVVSRPDATVLALGGASWPRLGSDGAWTDVLRRQGVAVAPLKAANAGFEVAWSERFRASFAGHPLKNIALSFGNHSVRGEAVVTRDGLEGGAIYALSALLREAILRDGSTVLKLSLKPDLDSAALIARLQRPRGKQSFSNFLRKALGLSPVSVALIQEAAMAARMSPSTMSSAALAELINNLPIRLVGIRPIERAISTAGGVEFAELDQRFMLRRKAGVFVAGEMLDWEAPTGGYLLQASFATGGAAARGVLEWLGCR
jgi:uncharacterized flavoprotein (TIGR03862 family)